MNETSRPVPALRIGPLAARIDPAEAAAYAAATGVPMPDDGSAPATFPAVWLWHPAAREAVASAAAGRVPLLTAQRFAYRRRLPVGAACTFEIERFSDAHDPDVVLIEARVFDGEGAVAATFSATYRLLGERAP